MGHSWREMDPAGAAEHDRLIDLKSSLMTRIERLPAKNLTVGCLLQIFDVYSRTSGSFNDGDAKVLQTILDNTRSDHPYTPVIEL